MVRKRKLESDAPDASAEENSSVSLTLQQTNRQQTAREDSPPGSGQNGKHSNDKRKKQSQPRIGQACDRCRVRKLTCDSAIICGYCSKAQVPCTTTDRLTGRVYPRGELERLEKNAADQLAHIRKLEARLRTLGEDVEQYQEAHPTTAHLSNAPYSSYGDNDGSRAWTDGRPISPSQVLHSSPYTDQNQSDSALRLPDLRTGLADKYLGFSTGPLKGSTHEARLNMLGWELNVSNFSTDVLGDQDVPESQYNQSYASFARSAFGDGAKGIAVAPPLEKEGLSYAEGYLAVLNAFLPILHKPTFMDLITRFYSQHIMNPTLGVTKAQMIMVHMMWAIMQWQDARRNWENTVRRKRLQENSNLHYHLCLGELHHLMAGQDLADIQALAMICSHVRNFPNPEISFILVNMAFSKAIELGLHKSHKRLASEKTQLTALEIEMRKRVFYSVLTIYVTISGKLGRPMPIRPEDFDIEIPEPMLDHLLDEKPFDGPRRGKCSFSIAVEAFKVESIYMGLYQNIYSTRRSSSGYMDFVRSAEKRIDVWRDQWPPEFLVDPLPTNPILAIFIHYLHMWRLEYRLLLRHPSLSLTNSTQFNEANLRACMETCREMLGRVQALQTLKSLDTTWYNCAVYILAIQTTLYCYSQLPDLLTTENLVALKKDMDGWLDIMGAIGNLMGSGSRLRETMRVHIRTGISHLESQLDPQPQKESQTGQSGSHLQTPMPQDTPFHQGGYDMLPLQNGYGSYGNEASVDGHSTGFTGQENPIQGSNAYQSLDQFNYPDPSNNHNYATPTPSYLPPPYPPQITSHSVAASHYEQHRHPTDIVTVSPDMYSQGLPTGNVYPQSSAYGIGPQSWDLYTQALPNQVNIGPQDYNPANTLLQLSNRVPSSKDGGMSLPEFGDAPTAQMWPWMMLQKGPGGQ